MSTYSRTVTPAVIGRVTVPAAMVPMTRITVATMPLPDSAPRKVNGSCRMPPAMATMIPASSVMPNTRQKLRATSRQDRPRARPGLSFSSTTTGVTRLNMVENQMVRTRATSPSSATTAYTAGGAPATKAMPTMRPRISRGPSPASSTSRVASSRLGSRGRVARQASAALICWPLTPRAMIGASSPARMACTMNVSSRVSPNAGTTTAMIRPTRCVAWAGVSCWPGVGRLRPPRLSRVRVMVAEMTAEIVMTTAARPRMALGLRRMEAKAPSRISPTPRGRSGITPGLGAASPYRGHWPARRLPVARPPGAGCP